ncbi:C-C motif chemokine 22 isoform X2 [Castor canadensis]|uniref:C-C motif chemokine n=1 Tax=Castor canadensis TaxID=51338 RepID=A0A8B7UKV0_CASCN|nr:C-C motif chemokine 22 [Castor canadensis]
MANLQGPLLAALILLSVVFPATNAGPYGINVEDSVCCRDYIRHTLPLTVVKRIYWTSDSCRRPGIVLQTFKDLEICANPRMPWVKRMLRKLG